MTQAYGSAFARIYNQKWTGFAQRAAPLIREYTESVLGQHSHISLLDLCCGTGNLTRHFLEYGYQVTGIDLSNDMLVYAKENNLPFLAAGQARFFQADASCFSLDEPVGLVVSTFDALNHLPDFLSLRNCFRCVLKSLEKPGIFIFDLNTIQGLKEQWNGVNVEDTPELFILNRAIWIEEYHRAYTQITGFSRMENGLYERVEESVYNTAFELQTVVEALKDSGFDQVHCSRLTDLATSLENPEGEKRVFFVAQVT